MLENTSTIMNIWLLSNYNRNWNKAMGNVTWCHFYTSYYVFEIGSKRGSSSPCTNCCEDLYNKNWELTMFCYMIRLILIVIANNSQVENNVE